MRRRTGVATKTTITTIEGPNGKAELYELAEEGAAVATEYVVEFKGQTTKYLTMGEAYIEAGEKAGTPT